VVLSSLSASTRDGKAAGELKTAPVSNSSSMARVWLAYTCWGLSCVLLFARSTRATCIQDSIPTRTSVGYMNPAAVEGPMVAAATTVGRMPT